MDNLSGYLNFLQKRYSQKEEEMKWKPAVMFEVFAFILLKRVSHCQRHRVRSKHKLGYSRRIGIRQKVSSALDSYKCRSDKHRPAMRQKVSSFLAGPLS